MAPGRHYNFKLRSKLIRDVSDSGDCIETGASGHLAAFPGYSYHGCLEECLSREEEAACNCAVFYDILYYEANRSCYTIDFYLCGYKRDIALGYYSCSCCETFVHRA